MISVATSVYLVVELVIALSAQGEPTGAVAPFTGAALVYPDWYQAPELLDAVWVAMLAYPAAAVLYGTGVLIGWAARTSFGEQSRMPPDRAPQDISSAEGAETPTAEAFHDLCVVSADRRIKHITPATARLFGLTPRDMLGQSLEAFLSPSDLPKLDALVAAAYAERPRAFATTVGILLPEAIVATMDLICRADEDDAAAPGGATLTIRPVSERGRLDDQLAALWY